LIRRGAPQYGDANLITVQPARFSSTALQQLVGFLKLANGIFESSACSTGLLLAVFERALAEQVLELIAANGFSQFETLIPSVASALGACRA
jgi:hypothetical protein